MKYKSQFDCSNLQPKGSLSPFSARLLLTNHFSTQVFKSTFFIVSIRHTNRFLTLWASSYGNAIHSLSVGAKSFVKPAVALQNGKSNSINWFDK